MERTNQWYHWSSISIWCCTSMFDLSVREKNTSSFIPAINTVQWYYYCFWISNVALATIIQYWLSSKQCCPKSFYSDYSGSPWWCHRVSYDELFILEYFFLLWVFILAINLMLAIDCHVLDLQLLMGNKLNFKVQSFKMLFTQSVVIQWTLLIILSLVLNFVIQMDLRYITFSFDS